MDAPVYYYQLAKEEENSSCRMEVLDFHGIARHECILSQIAEVGVDDSGCDLPNLKLNWYAV